MFWVGGGVSGSRAGEAACVGERDEDPLGVVIWRIEVVKSSGDECGGDRAALRGVVVDGGALQGGRGELVTGADVEAERLLTRRWTDLLPAAVVGQEACVKDPTLLTELGSARAWLVDPVDGTTNFVEGNPDWAVMVP